MQRPLFKKPQDPNFSDISTQNHFINKTNNAHDLLLKELSVNIMNQNLLEQRIHILSQSIQFKDSKVLQDSIAQIEMDKIELSELKIRELEINKILNNK